jgi:hypothetical protein
MQHIVLAHYYLIQLFLFHSKVIHNFLILDFNLIIEF